MRLKKVVWDGKNVSLVTPLSTQYISLRASSFSVSYGKWEGEFPIWNFICQNYLKNKKLEENITSGKRGFLPALRKGYEKELR